MYDLLKNMVTLIRKYSPSGLLLMLFNHFTIQDCKVIFRAMVQEGVWGYF